MPIRPRNVVVAPRRKLVRGTQPAPEPSGGGLYFSSPKENIQFIRTGCTLLDCVLGGGWALGRASNLVGDKSTGKTLLAMEAVANLFLQYENPRCRYNETEAAFDRDYAGALGIPMDRVEMLDTCTTVEELYQDVEDWLAALSKGQPALYIVDSLDALSDAAELERAIDQSSYGGAKAKKLSEFFRRKVQALKQTNVHLMIISQIRDNIGAMFGNKHTRSGGKALDFYMSQIIWLQHMKTLKRTVNKVERAVGVTIKAKNTKNKVGLPYRECQFDITFGFGTEDVEASRQWLKDAGDPAGAKLEGDELRGRTIATWAKVDETFLPTVRKYG